MGNEDLGVGVGVWEGRLGVVVWVRRGGIKYGKKNKKHRRV